VSVVRLGFDQGSSSSRGFNQGSEELSGASGEGDERPSPLLTVTFHTYLDISNYIKTSSTSPKLKKYQLLGHEILMNALDFDRVVKQLERESHD